MSAPSPSPGWQAARPSRQGRPLQAKLVQSDDRTVAVQFSYPPEKFKLSTTAKSDPKPSTANTSEAGGAQTAPGQPQRVTSEVVAWGELALTVEPLYLIGQGKSVMADIRTLLKWTNSGKKLPTLLFSIGSEAANTYRVTVKSVTINVERYDPSGDPIRANVSLTMLVLPAWLEATNPSSRGESGSSVRPLVDGESMCRVAELAYGHPRYWRQVAEANDLDDPLKVLPGRSIYLPPPDRVQGQSR
ncbi:MAG: hypothetical protein ACR2N4_14135 [Jatrophihabitans sp.]